MEQQGQNANAVGLASKVDPKTIGDMLKARRDSRIGVVEKVAKVLGLSAWQLLATDLDGVPPKDKDALKLLELFLTANEASRDAILKVAIAVANRD